MRQYMIYTSILKSTTPTSEVLRNTSGIASETTIITKYIRSTVSKFEPILTIRVVTATPEVMN